MIPATLLAGPKPSDYSIKQKPPGTPGPGLDRGTQLWDAGNLKNLWRMSIRPEEDEKSRLS